MGLPRLRFTVRRMMIAVAVVAVGLAVVVGWTRSVFCLKRAAWHAVHEARLRADGRMLASHSLLIRANLADSDAAEHARLRARYQYVASRPWEPLPDDPLFGETTSAEESPFLLGIARKRK